MSLLRTAVLAVVACLAALAFTTGTAGADGPTARAAANCKDIRPGDGYIVNIKTRGVGCKTGRRVAKAHRSCRLANGKRGKCTRRVRGYRCKEGRRNSISTQFTAKVSCKRGSKRVSFVYQQNT
jgi:hypothetical protein